MEEMKMDKTGACTVIAAIATVARLAPGTPLLALAPAVENMPGPHSTRPGDIVTALNGKKVDVTNTDAEGRLILGDAMTYAERLGATHLVDVATLTGAVARALGHLVTGAFGTPQPFYDEVMAAADRAGERYWQLPLVEEYRADLDSWYGDIQNSGTVEGVARQERPVPPRVRDQAVGPPRHRRHRRTSARPLPFAPKGATGVAHATLVELALAGAARLTAGTPALAPRPNRPTTEPWTAVGRPRSGGLCCSVSPPTGSRPAGPSTTKSTRRVDGSTGERATVAFVGALAFGLLPIRFGGDPVAFAVFGAWFVTLVVGLATDLDQRLLPDLLTLPVIPVALVYALTGQQSAGRFGHRPRGARGRHHPGCPVSAVHPVRGGRLRARRRQAPRRCRPARRRRTCARERRLRTRPERRRADHAPRDEAHRPANLCAVRSVLHRRRAVGGADSPIEIRWLPCPDTGPMYGLDPERSLIRIEQVSFPEPVPDWAFQFHAKSGGGLTGGAIAQGGRLRSTGRNLAR